jgi:hypothetical protein
MADDELDRLYWVPPEDFIAERTKLTAAAKKRGDPAAAKRVSAARKPTTAAWIVNRLALRHKDSTKRLDGLGNRLRAAHADMDGARIRDLSAEQHQLINELTRAAFAAAGIEKPSSTVREDVTSTLQAAVADPEVSGRLGRLARPEQWTGFGAFGDATAVQRTTRAGKAKGDRAPSQSAPAKDSARDETERQRRKLTAALAAAEQAKSEADERLSERDAERDAARQRRDDALAALRVAEREVSSAEERYSKATQASRAAAESVKETKAQLRRL